MEEFVENEQDLQLCYGRYCNRREKFTIVPGHRDLLMSVSKICQELLNEVKKEGKLKQKSMFGESSGENSLESNKINISSKPVDKLNDPMFAENLRRSLLNCIKKGIFRIADSENLVASKEIEKKLDAISLTVVVSSAPSMKYSSNIKCIVCNSSRTVYFDHSWKMNNFLTHIKDHIKTFAKQTVSAPKNTQPLAHLWDKFKAKEKFLNANDKLKQLKKIKTSVPKNSTKNPQRKENQGSTPSSRAAMMVEISRANCDHSNESDINCADLKRKNNFDEDLSQTAGRSNSFNPPDDKIRKITDESVNLETLRIKIEPGLIEGRNFS